MVLSALREKISNQHWFSLEIKKPRSAILPYFKENNKDKELRSESIGILETDKIFGL